MRDALKALGCCLIAQALLVLRTRLGFVFFGDESVLALTGIAAALGGATLAIVHAGVLRAQLNWQTFGLAMLAALFGVTLHSAFDLAGRAEVGAAEASLMAYAAPLFATLIMLAFKWEAPDTLRVAGIALGLGSIGWLIAGPESAKALAGEPRGVMLLTVSGLALAAFLVVAQKLVEAASVEFAAAFVLLVGGILTLGLVGPAALGAVQHITTQGLQTFLAALALTGGMVLAYGLLFSGLRQLKVSTVGASFLTAAPWSAVYMAVFQGAQLTGATLLGAGGALAGFVLVAIRDKKG